MSMDQYSRHNDDNESGLVPPQSAPSSDWPRKIRSLSTDDLDRLTIDSAGRFYWDGQLVNYGFAKPDGQLLDARELSSLATSHKETTTGGTPMAEPAFTTKDSTLDALAEALAATPAPSETPTVVVAPPVSAPITGAPVAPPSVATAPIPSNDTAPVARRDTDVVAVVNNQPRRFKLSAWQSIGAFLAVLSVILGGIGLAASGVATAHEYACRVGLTTAYCPPKPVVATPARPPRVID